MGEPTDRRKAALHRKLEQALSIDGTLSCEEISGALLFGLDHGLATPDAVHRAITAGLDCDILRARFAGRLAAYDHTEMWTDLWTTASRRTRTLLAINAFDTLGDDAVLLGLEPEEIGDLWQFVRAWVGGGCLERLESSGSSWHEHALRVSEGIAALPSSLIVIGFSAAGKSTLTRSLASYGETATDVDDLVASADAKRLRTIFSELGAVAARDLIYTRLVETSARRNDLGITAMGGSTTSIPDARRLLTRSQCPILHATLPPSVATERLRNAKTHPLSEFAVNPQWGPLIEDVALLRSDHYYMADWRVDTECWPLDRVRTLDWFR